MRMSGGVLVIETNDRVKIAAESLGISYESALKNCEIIAEHGLLYAWDPKRGGRAVLVAPDHTKLVASSAVKFEQHLASFVEGNRN